MEIDQVRQEYPHLVALFKSSSFPSELAKGLSLALDDLGDRPIIVRSSSLLEDRAGAAFSGKYKSLFLGNQGHKERAPGRADGRHRRGLCVDLRSRSHRVPRRARPARCPRRDGHSDPGSRRPGGRQVFLAGMFRRGVQQQRISLVGAHQPQRWPDPPGSWAWAPAPWIAWWTTIPC